MQTQITARHFEANDTLKEYAAKKLAKLEKYYDGITDARIVLAVDGSAGSAKSAEIVVRVYQQTLSAASDGATHEQAVDGCVEALRRQVKKYKAKLRSKDKDYHR